MEHYIRFYNNEDYEMLRGWWASSNRLGPQQNMMSESSSLILEIEDKPVLSITVYFTNASGVCFLENFVGNPDFKGPSRKEAAKLLVEFSYEFAKSMGYKNIVGFGTHEKLNKYYEELGMKPMTHNITSFVREL